MSATRLVRRAAPPTIAAVARIAKAIEAWARERRIADKTLRELLLVHDELASNVARHADGARSMSVTVEVDAPRGRLRYRLADDAPEFDPTARATPDTAAPLAERAPGGLGIHLVRTLARDVRWRREGGKNLLEIELALS